MGDHHNQQTKVSNFFELSTLQSMIEESFNVQVDDIRHIQPSKIFTKVGDHGATRLLSGEYISKGNIIIETSGAIQLLNAHLGECTSMIDTYRSKHPKNSQLDFISGFIKSIQMNLQDIGSIISDTVGDFVKSINWNHSEQIEIMELVLSFIDHLNIPLTRFILPGGHKIASKIFMTSAFCRTIEPVLVRTTEKYLINENIQKYINRLSDLLFVIGRFINRLFNIPDVIYIKK